MTLKQAWDRINTIINEMGGLVDTNGAFLLLRKQIENEMIAGAEHFEDQVNTTLQTQTYISLITLEMIDDLQAKYLHAADEQSKYKNGSNEYWNAFRVAQDLNTKLINLHVHYKAQEEKLNREALDRNSEALIRHSELLAKWMTKH